MATPTRRGTRRRQHALLRVRVGEEVQRDGLGVLAQAGFAMQLEGGGEAAQAAIW